MYEEYIVIHVSVPDVTVANQIAHTLLQHKKAACVQILPAMRSLYMWQEQLEESTEQLLMIKTQSVHFSDVEALVKEHHPYDTPEVIAVPILAGSQSYLDWIKDIT